MSRGTCNNPSLHNNPVQMNAIDALKYLLFYQKIKHVLTYCCDCDRYIIYLN